MREMISSILVWGLMTTTALSIMYTYPVVAMTVAVLAIIAAYIGGLWNGSR